MHRFVFVFTATNTNGLKPFLHPDGWRYLKSYRRTYQKLSPSSLFPLTSFEAQWLFQTFNVLRMSVKNKTLRTYCFCSCFTILKQLKENTTNPWHLQFDKIGALWMSSTFFSASVKWYKISLSFWPETNRKLYFCCANDKLHDTGPRWSRCKQLMRMRL